MISRRSNAIAETGVAFYSAGGHSHDGENSSVIDAKSYSIFDFSFGRVSTNAARINEQNKNQEAFKNYIISTVNSSVLEPAGVVLQDNIINSRNIIAGSITSDLIAANTITADNIAAGTITADKLDANAISANSITIGVDDYWSSNGYFRLGGATGIAYNGPGSNITFGSGITITGNIASTGTISGGTISGSTITGSSVSTTFLYAFNGTIGGWTLGLSSITAGSSALYSNGLIVGGIFQTKLSTTGSIRMGTNIGNGEELEFYRSDSASSKNTLRTVAGSDTFRISTIGGYTYNFDTEFSTNRNISGGSFSTSGSITGSGTLSIGTAGAGLLVVPASYVRSERIYNTVTGSAANMHIGSNYSIYRSSSSIKYKTDINSLSIDDAKKILNFRPVKYKSLCEDDPDDQIYYGLIAEEVSDIEPAFVHWSIKDDLEKEPEGVQYERIVSPLITLVKDLYNRVEALESKIQGV